MAKHKEPDNPIADSTPPIAAFLPRTLNITGRDLNFVSVFQDEAIPRLDGAVSECKGDKVKGLFKFMGLEKEARVSNATTPEERRTWEDAGNLTTGLRYVILDEAAIISGADIEHIREGLKEHDEAATESDPYDTWALARVYLAARRYLFPEAK